MVDHAVDAFPRKILLDDPPPPGLAWRGWMSSDTQHYEGMPAISGRGAQFNNMDVVRSRKPAMWLYH